jgi:Uma2 family endonuclease
MEEAMMDTAERAGRIWTADEFLQVDQYEFGPAWRYELVSGRIVAHAAPTPDHGAIVVNLSAALKSRLRGHPSGCRPEAGSGAAPKRQQRDTSRIPDVIVRCGEHPRVVFEIISPSELRHWRQRDQKRRDLQEVEGIAEIVEVYQADAAIHIYRRAADGSWPFEAIGGLTASLRLESVGLEIPLAEIYEGLEIEPLTDEIK